MEREEELSKKLIETTEGYEATIRVVFRIQGEGKRGTRRVTMRVGLIELLRVTTTTTIERFQQ